MLVLAVLAPAVLGGCQPPPIPQASAPPPVSGAWADCARPPKPPIAAAHVDAAANHRTQTCRAWRAGRRDAHRAAAATVQAEADRTATDGYRMREAVSLIIAILAATLAGAVLGACLQAWIRRRRRDAYARHVLAVLQREAQAGRVLVEAGDAPVRELLAPAIEALDRAEAYGRELSKQAAALDKRRPNATRRTRLEAIYRRVDALTAEVEGLHLALRVWQTRAARDGVDTIRPALDRAVARIDAAQGEVPAPPTAEAAS